MAVTVPSDKARATLERTSNPGRALAEAVESGKLKMSPVLAAVGIDPNNPTHQAALLICEKYGFDPLLKHVVVIPAKGPYVTRDGLLYVAHRSGQFDGIEITATGETDTHFTATASVWRKDMGRAFVYPGRYPKNGGNKSHGPEMAIKCAESMALRRAFAVAAPSLDEAWDVDVIEQHDEPVAPVGSPNPEMVEVVDAELVEPETETGDQA